MVEANTQGPRHAPMRPAAAVDALLLHSMRDPASVVRLSLTALDAVLHAARQHTVLGRLGHDLAALGVLAELPPAARQVLANAHIRARANAIALRFEVDRARRALAPLGTKVVLLKGAAYQHAGMALARGRLSVDLDILVPAGDIGRAERRLIDSGWQPGVIDRYDQHYYRDWMHEIPPLLHPERKIELDVHHTIFPPISGIRIDAATLLAEAVPLADGLFMLAPADMVLHAATHMFHENPAGRLRDLLDLHDLLTQFAATPGFWDSLLERARRHGLGRPLHYALRYTTRMLGTAVPDAVVQRAAAAFAPDGVRGRLMDWLMRVSLVGHIPGQQDRGFALASSLLFVRYHWIKMPPGVLGGHFLTKTVRRMHEARAR